MQFNEARRSIATDFVPRGSLCEWCGEPAERHLTAIGGAFHNEGGRFCRPCGEQFSQIVINSLRQNTPVQIDKHHLK